MFSFLQNSLDEIKSLGLYRENKTWDPLDATHVRDPEGKTCLVLASNNYLGLTHHPELINAAVQALQRWGTGSGSARLITGSHPLYETLERNLAAYKSAEEALTFNTGYMANVGIIGSLMTKGDLIFSDALNHASIIDGCRLSGAKIIVYPHCDTDALKKLLQDTPLEGGSSRKRLIVTDGVFSMDGDIAPLDRIVPLAQKYGAILMVDDAHATGVLGRGRGTAHHFGLADKVDIQMGTLSKALASEGAYVTGSSKLIGYLTNKARSFIFSTALSPATIAAANAAVSLLSKSDELVQQLGANAAFMREKLAEQGVKTPDSPTPIIPIIIGGNREAVEAAASLREEGIIVGAIRPPTVPAGQSRLRITVSAAHSREELAWTAERIGLVIRNEK
ncbi:8-amino-7-oxononanoate synthase [Treponema primitia ZAS-2]|uniref:8-amino-7-ketopelargonate synthase n=1 Tax=Treponema primitia (strain ATCC BAA-887 / DSM 12427 / ZAS-2) TaxID=545694 RepID=F5YMQ1_TREPZ|nr:8-amino-7-oxononanoate synthase [Treponema primitia]AEF86382.1 8-amino-7-oxononanoate synthase [Treponema primitia ZAS-2]